MLSIGEFSKICQVTTKTLRYYEEIGLIYPCRISEKTGYRYYSIDQLETMLFINKLKQYQFTLDEIKDIVFDKEYDEKKLYEALVKKKKEIDNKLQAFQDTLEHINQDMEFLSEGKSVMSYLEDIDVTLFDVPKMCLLSKRAKIKKGEFEQAYNINFGKLFQKIAIDRLTMVGAPMVLFHDDEFKEDGMDTEFAIPVKEYVTGTRNFNPGLCLKTVVKGPYDSLADVYTKQISWACEHGYVNDDALFEMYISNPSQVKTPDDLVTEVYYPVKKV